MSWNIFYQDYTNNKRKVFTIKATSKHEATEKAIKKCFNDRNLNHYEIKLAYNF